MKSVRLIVDGSALGNPGVGGWACIIEYQAYERILTGSEQDSTNNRMGMVAALRGLQALKEPCRVEILTDSEYLQRGMTQFLDRWKANGWRSGSGRPVVNRELRIRTRRGGDAARGALDVGARSRSGTTRSQPGRLTRTTGRDRSCCMRRAYHY